MEGVVMGKGYDSSEYSHINRSKSSSSTVTIMLLPSKLLDLNVPSILGK